MLRTVDRRPRLPMVGRCRRSIVITIATATAGSLLTSGAVEAAPGQRDAPVIAVLSNRADLVSGGDALVEVELPEGADPKSVKVALDGRDISHEFALRRNGQYMGLVTGLREGQNELSAHVSRNEGAKITITNHSKQGPVLSGKQLQPWICETQASGLGPATGPACVAPTKHDYFYKSAVTGQVEPYDLKDPPAAALIANTTTDQGKNVPYIVRRELGVINRGIYEILVLHKPGEAWTPWERPRSWNGKLHWFFQGGWGPWHRQSRGAPNEEAHFANNAGGTVDPALKIAEIALSRGFAVATTNLTRANNLLGAESVIMVKEHFIETYGPVRYTTASGCSGGSASQHEIANNYPGVLDGLIPMCAIPDVWTITPGGVDCVLLGRYFRETSPHLWTDPTARIAVSGTNAGISCEEWGAEIPTRGNIINTGFFDPTKGCTTNETSTGSEPDWVYHPDRNPDGVRCTIQEVEAAAFGYRDSDGFANRPWDNVGVQYGLEALRDGKITAEQFVDLNSKLGAFDIDYRWIPERVEADREGLRNLYRAGVLNDGSNLARVPIIDLRSGLNEEIHESVYTQMVRARLMKANGHAHNHVIWKFADSLYMPASSQLIFKTFATLDEWLTAIESDKSGDPIEEKVRVNKPSIAKDTCWAANTPDSCQLSDYQNTRMVAGGPVANDVFKCQLKSIDWSEYGSVEFSEGQKKRLLDVFPNGVCDWAKPGVEQQPMNGPWQSFMDKAGGQPMGQAPRSSPIEGGEKVNR